MMRVLVLVGGLVAVVFLLVSWLAPGSLGQLTQGEGLLALMQLVALLVLVVPALFWSRARGGEGPTSIREGLVHALIWCGILVFVMAAYSQRASFQRLWADLTGEVDPAQVMQRGEALVIRRSGDGHFWARIEINGVAVRGMIDTGASNLALSARDASAAGIGVGALRYSVPVSTATGEDFAAAVTVDQLRFGPLEAEGVEALVLPQGGDTTLIGQDVLAGFAEVTTRGDEMVLVP
jgi:aspartyl protease family protein